MCLIKLICIFVLAIGFCLSIDSDTQCPLSPSNPLDRRVIASSV